jgi:hypothetical protein
MTPRQATHLIRFLREPTSRKYVINYPTGRELCRSYVAGQAERFRRLITEQTRVSDLLDTNAVESKSRSGGQRGAEQESAS